MSDVVQQEWWGHQFEAILEEIGRAAFICEVRLLDPGVIDAVLRGDPSVCGTSNPAAFKKLRELMMLGFIVRGKAFERMGAQEAQSLLEAIRDRLVVHFGGNEKLGGPGAAR
jgi:hypothetical protein